jgi:hypothetical protein
MKVDGHLLYYGARGDFLALPSPILWFSSKACRTIPQYLVVLCFARPFS